MEPIRNAVILAAGLGSRLRPLTDEVPKCLTEVAGEPILIHALKALAEAGVTDVVVIIGYLGDEIRNRAGASFRGMRISYLENARYAETGTARSAFLAEDYLRAGAYLIEGDTIFDPAILQIGQDRPTWYVDDFAAGETGSQIRADGTGRIVSYRMIRDRGEAGEAGAFKSCGVLRLPAGYGGHLAAWLAEAGDHDYYDDVIARHIDEPIYAEHINGFAWQEIDDRDDLRAAEDQFAPWKYAVVVIDGGADDPQDALGGQTPFEAAKTPGLDELARSGRTGMMRTMYPGLPLGSVVAIMGILGYNPARYYPHGRASFEALAKWISLSSAQLAFRCNLVSTDGGKLVDFTAGNISTEAAAGVIARIAPPEGMRLIVGQGYRHLLIVDDPGCGPSDIICPEPHMNVGGVMSELRPRPANDSGRNLADRLGALIDLAAGSIAPFSLMPWSPSSKPALPSFSRRTGIDATVITAMDFLRGIAIAAHMEARPVADATGDSDTDLGSKMEAAIGSLWFSDLVLIHVNGPDEEAHRRSIAGKVDMLERIDRELIRPLRRELDDEYPGRYRLAVLPDHVTRCSDGKHGAENVPYVIYGRGVSGGGEVSRFSEREIAASSRTVLKSYEFVGFLLA